MTEIAWKTKTSGDTVVEGLFGGLIAGLMMTLFLVVMALISGTAPLSIVGYFDPTRTGNWLTGLLAHLAVSGIYGLIFGLSLWTLSRIRPSLATRVVLWGTLYGLLLLLLAWFVLLPGSDIALLQIPAWQFALAHLVYGLTIGSRLSRRKAS